MPPYGSPQLTAAQVELATAWYVVPTAGSVLPYYEAYAPYIDEETIGVTAVGLRTATLTVRVNDNGADAGLTLQNNGGDDLVVESGGVFAFQTSVRKGDDYLVTVLTQPGDLSQTCSVPNGGGTVAEMAVTDIAVSCATDSFTVGGQIRSEACWMCQ